jgi:hypothetical protein
MTDLPDNLPDNLPDYLYRPDDYSIFYKVKTEEGFTYIHEISFERGYKGHGHQYKTLIACDFKPCTKADFKELAAKKKEYYEWLSWSCRNDGHGGCKGGTMEEFRNRKIYLPIKLKGTKSHE